MKTRNRISVATAILLALAPIAFAQQSAPQPKPPEYVEEKGFKGKVFEVKHRDPDTLYNVLKPLSSGFRGATISTSHEFGTVTVRDFPENIMAIEEALKRLDVPEPAGPEPPDVEIHGHVLVASSTGAAGDDYPSELADVLKQLQATLKYKNYSLMASSIHRTKIGGLSRGVNNKGVAESKLFNVNTSQGNPIFYNYSIGPMVFDGSRILMPSFSFQMRIPLSIGGSTQYDNVGFESPVTLREGERVVVGTTTMAEKGIIVVVSAKVIK